MGTDTPSDEFFRQKAKRLEKEERKLLQNAVTKEEHIDFFQGFLRGVVEEVSINRKTGLEESIDKFLVETAVNDGTLKKGKLWGMDLSEKLEWAKQIIKNSKVNN